MEDSVEISHQDKLCLCTIHLITKGIGLVSNQLRLLLEK
jgi:hypothetical protein